MSQPIIDILYAIGGFILGGFVTYKYRIFSYKRTKYIDACIEFKDAFSDIIHWLNFDSMKNSERVFGKLHQSDIAERHEGAIKKFRGQMKPSKHWDFDRTCKKFYNEKNNRKYEGYASPNREESIRLALDNIEELFRFAKG